MKKHLIPFVIGTVCGFLAYPIGLFLGLQGPPGLNLLGAAVIEVSLWLPMRIFSAGYLGALSRAEWTLSVIIMAMEWGLIAMGIAALRRFVRDKKNNSPKPQ